MALDPIKRDAELARIHREMNIVHGTRVSWEDKRRYTDWLAKLTAEGHLTADEYTARMEWVEASHTEQDLRVAFVDLPQIPLTPRPVPKQSNPFGFVRTPCWFGSFAAWFIFALGIATGQLSTVLIGLFWGLFLTLITVFITVYRKG